MEEKQIPTCACGDADYMDLSYSGASDVGFIADQAARKLLENKVRKMNCLTVVATGSEEKPEKFRKCNILVIDGCN